MSAGANVEEGKGEEEGVLKWPRTEGLLRRVVRMDLAMTLLQLDFLSFSFSRPVDVRW